MEKEINKLYQISLDYAIITSNHKITILGQKKRIYVCDQVSCSYDTEKLYQPKRFDSLYRTVIGIQSIP